jgi:restriction system protein
VAGENNKFTNNMRRRKNNNDDFSDLIPGFVFLFVLYFVYLWFYNRQQFWQWLIIGLIAIIAIFFIVSLIFKKIAQYKENKAEEERQQIVDLGLDKDINDFIIRFGKERGRYAWKYGKYGFDFKEREAFLKRLSQRGLRIDDDKLKEILKDYIDKKVEDLINGSLESEKFNEFSKLTGIEFELLLVKLFEAMGLIVQHTGGTGDQGGDLILNRDGKRILVQAKRYSNFIGNSAVQEAVGAIKYHDCSSAVVVGTNDFTPGAKQLAAANNVKLMDKKELQSLLLKFLKESWN